MVVLKRVEYKHELEIMTFFNTEPFKSHPKNHCIALFDTLYHPDSEWTVMVMPHMRELDDPEFETVGELVELFRQLFEVSSFPNHHVSASDHTAFGAGNAVHTLMLCSTSVRTSKALLDARWCSVIILVTANTTT